MRCLVVTMLLLLVSIPVHAQLPAVASDAFDFKDVPAVRPFTRSGMFSIPPTGPGYYSAYDALTGTVREAAPKYPYPAFASNTLSFFNADWKFVDAPKYQPDFLERLKRIHVGDHWLFSTGGQTWFRYASEYDSRLSAKDNNYAIYRVRPYFDMWYEDRFRIFVEGIFADSVWQDLPPLGTDRDRADFQNLFVDVKVCELLAKPVYVRVGRQEVSFGSQRAVSTPDWANTRRTFEGVRILRTGEQWDTDFFWMQPVVPNATRLNSTDDNQNLGGAKVSYSPKKGTRNDLYYLLLDNSNAVTQQGVARSPFTLHTIGARTAGDRDEEWLWDLEGAVQLGRNGPREVVAGMATAGVGYHSKTLPWNPTAWIYYDYASGDGTPNRGRTSTYNQLFPFGHYYFGWVDVVGRQNIHDASSSLHLFPTRWLTLWLQYHHFWLDQSRDALYNSAGNATRRDPTGRAGNNIGDEIDVILNFHLTKRADLLTGYSQLFGGRYLRQTKSATSADNSGLYYLSYSYRW